MKIKTESFVEHRSFCGPDLGLRWANGVARLIAPGGSTTTFACSSCSSCCGAISENTEFIGYFNGGLYGT